MRVFICRIRIYIQKNYQTTWHIINNPNDDVNTQKVVILVLDKVIGSKMQFSLKNGQNQWFSGHFSLNKIVF